MPRSRLRKGIDWIADLIGGPYHVEHVSPTRWALWSQRVTYYLPPDSTYDDLALWLEQMEEDDDLARLIGKRRTARIQIQYDRGRGRVGEYTLAEIGAWSWAVSRALARVTVADDDDDPLVERYGVDGETSRVMRLLVWFGDDMRDYDAFDF